MCWPLRIQVLQHLLQGFRLAVEDDVVHVGKGAHTTMLLVSQTQQPAYCGTEEKRAEWISLRQATMGGDYDLPILLSGIGTAMLIGWLRKRLNQGRVGQAGARAMIACSTRWRLRCLRDLLLLWLPSGTSCDQHLPLLRY